MFFVYTKHDFINVYAMSGGRRGRKGEGVVLPEEKLLCSVCCEPYLVSTPCRCARHVSRS
jgi:hypothetical protein